MSLKPCIERLFNLNSQYLHADQAFNQASSLQTLSDDLYSDPFRFVYELVQNADDASSTQLQIALVDNDYLIIAHNGRPFDEKDVRSICAVNNSTKTREPHAAGYKGLGFKAIFGKSKYVLIVSKAEAFRFDAKYAFHWSWEDVDQETWENDNGRKFIHPWQICPIWTAEQQIPPCIRNWMADSMLPVHIIIRLDHVEETQTTLRRLANQPYTFLFLRYIRQVKFTGLLPPSDIRIEHKPDGSARLSSNGKEISQWLVGRREVVIPPDILKDDRIPVKLQQALSTEIVFAAKIDCHDGKKFIPIEIKESVLFAYMPTKIATYGLPLFVNANFLTNASREQIHTDLKWNQWLFECLPREMIEWIKDLLNKSPANKSLYALLPAPAKGDDELAKKYNETRSKVLGSTKFIRNARGDYLTVEEAIIDLTDLSNQPFIGPEPIRQHIIHHYTSVPTRMPMHPFIGDNTYLREHVPRTFDWEQAILMFQTKSFQENFSANRARELVSFLFDRKSDEEMVKVIHRIPFIMDRNKCLRTPTAIYFPSQYDDSSWHCTNSSDAYVHQDLMRQLSPDDRQYLEQLGISVKTDLTFFYRNIVPKASTFITPDNAVLTIQQLFRLFINTQLPAKDLAAAGELSLRTTANTLVPANRLYLSAVYKPHLPLDSILPAKHNLFVSPTYLQDNRHEDYKRFFRLLGVQENIEVMPLNDNSRLFRDYHTDQTRIIFGLNSQQVHGYRNRLTLRYIEFTEDNHAFASFFWSHIIRTIDVRVLNHSEVVFWGAPHRRGATTGSEVNTFPQWFIRTRPCIPSSICVARDQYARRCYRGPEVFTGRLRPLIGRYLPIFDCMENQEPLSSEWETFFRFRTEVSIDEHFVLLRQIYIQNRNGISGEDEMRIQTIYTSLLKELCRTDQHQREVYQKQCQAMNLCLLSATDNLFMPPEELRFWSVQFLPPPTELHTLKLGREMMCHQQLALLLQVLNVNETAINNLNFIPMNANPCDELSDRLQKAHFRLLLDFFHIPQPAKVNQLDTIKFFECDRLEFYLSHSNTLVGTTQTHVKDNCLYLTRPWNAPSILDHLPTKLCELLGLPTLIFKKHVEALLTQSVDAYFCQLGILPNSTETFSDPLIKQVEQKNQELLDRFSSVNDPAQLLMAGLKAQESPWSGYVYHYTHLENAFSIIRDRSIKSRHQFGASKPFKDSSAYDFMSQTDERINHYARFYFRPRTTTQAHNQNLGYGKDEKHGNGYRPMCPVPVFFQIDLQAILDLPNIRWKVSLGDMSRDRTEYDCTLDAIKRFDFCGLFADNGSKHNGQLEFLIEDQLDLQSLPNKAIHLVCQNDDAKRSLESVFTEEFKLDYDLRIDKDYYFGSNDRIFINHDRGPGQISVLIESTKARADGEMLIVQIKSNGQQETDDVACHGNLRATFHHNNITTIYGRDKNLDVLIGKRPYAVYYQFERQKWLVYANHHQYDFDTAHTKEHVEFLPYE